MSIGTLADFASNFGVAQVRHDHAEKFEHLDSFEFDVQHRPNSGPPLAQKGPPRRPVPVWTPAAL